MSIGPESFWERMTGTPRENSDSCQRKACRGDQTQQGTVGPDLLAVETGLTNSRCPSDRWTHYFAKSGIFSLRPEAEVRASCRCRARTGGRPSAHRRSNQPRRENRQKVQKDLVPRPALLREVKVRGPDLGNLGRRLSSDGQYDASRAGYSNQRLSSSSRHSRPGL